MLRSLKIQNYALIEKLDISFNEGFSVITGETGAGKSIILGAIGLLLGQRADIKSIRTGATKCIVEAHFDVASYDMCKLFEDNELEYDDECILRRELLASGKSRAFVNDTPVQLSLMKELGERLIDVHSQHQNLLLNKEDFQMSVLDVLADNDGLMKEYKELYQAWKKAKHDLENLKIQAEQERSDEDYLRFQLEQLESAAFKDGEQEELEQEAEVLSHAEEIKEQLYRLEQLLNGEGMNVLSALKECTAISSLLGKVFSQAGEIYSRLDSAYIELKDLADEIADYEENIEVNPRRLEEVNERLNLLYTLQQKHRVSDVSSLLAIQADFASRLSTITSFDEEIVRLEQLSLELFGKVKKQALLLTNSRKQSGKVMEKHMKERLMPLGMPNVQFVVEIGERKEPCVSGMDTVIFLFSANKNGSLNAISSVASGGEIARVMLSLKALIAKAVKLPTIIFDEIDTGVSGEIADRMADIMLEMGGNERQVISITHLPQIASRGKQHYKVYKEDNDMETNSHIRNLNHQERVEEIAHMLSGASLTEAALQNAHVLLDRNNNK